MSGYRQSSYDPAAYETPGKPLRPFNWLQWVGVALEVVGLALFLENIAERIGWLPRLLDLPSIAPLMLMLVGMTLINSRRAPPHDTTPEQHAANRRLLIITVAVCAAVLGLAAAIEFLGA